MRSYLFPIAVLTVLGGCVEVDPGVTTMAPTAADRSSPAYRACVAAIAAQTGRSQADVAVYDYLFSEAGTQVSATVAGAEAPWRCLAANDGTVEEVAYTGSEGFL